MKKNAGRTYALWILGTEAVGALAGWLTREGTEIFNLSVAEPPFSPPAAIFPIVWTILYLLMGIGAARIAMAPPSDARSRSLTLYLVQLFFNFLWPFVFFNLQWYGAAFLWLIALWLLVFFMIQSFRAVDPSAAALQLPYLIWLTFAAYLNLGVWLLNR
ncbi:MAG: tryptophan-rich sensory protein [Butyricicoccus sp.]|nr:tryptophan-rich sensory protein [Butyricicoccus sp.]